jgi:glutaryl-CoA dehydrogenase
MTDLLTGDFYRFEELLDPAEPEILDGVRTFLRADVAPVANEYRTRGEFPHHLVPGFAALGVAEPAHPRDGVPGPRSLLSGFLAMELAHTDASMATFFGVRTGLATGSIATCGTREINTLVVGRAVTGIGAFV